MKSTNIISIRLIVSHEIWRFRSLSLDSLSNSDTMTQCVCIASVANKWVKYVFRESKFIYWNRFEFMRQTVRIGHPAAVFINHDFNAEKITSSLGKMYTEDVFFRINCRFKVENTCHKIPLHSIFFSLLLKWIIKQFTSF